MFSPAAHRGERKPAIFNVHTAAIPVICEFGRTVLELIQPCVESKIDRPAEPTLVRAAIPEDRAELIELLRDWGRARSGDLSRCVQQRVARADREQSEVVIKQYGAGIHASGPKVIIRVPLDVAARVQRNPQAGNQWREPALISEKCDSGQVHGAG